MKILLLGESGYVGQAIAQKLEENYEVYGTYHTQANLYCDNDRMFRFELGKTDIIKSILDCVQPQIVISSLRGDFQLQLKAHNLVADYILGKKDGKIIYISTANAFDGRNEKPHYELDKTASQSDYGNFKIKCEQMLRDKLGDRCIIIRVPQIWGKDCPRILKLIEDTKNKFLLQHIRICMLITQPIFRFRNGLNISSKKILREYFILEQKIPMIICNFNLNFQEPLV